VRSLQPLIAPSLSPAAPARRQASVHGGRPLSRGGRHTNRRERAHPVATLCQVSGGESPVHFFLSVGLIVSRQ
jgi:hypothetical protein